MKAYSEAKIELVSLSVVDVITASGSGAGMGWDDGDTDTTGLLS